MDIAPYVNRKPHFKPSGRGMIATRRPTAILNQRISCIAPRAEILGACRLRAGSDGYPIQPCDICIQATNGHPAKITRNSSLIQLRARCRCTQCNKTSAAGCFCNTYRTAVLQTTLPLLGSFFAVGCYIWPAADSVQLSRRLRKYMAATTKKTLLHGNNAVRSRRSAANDGKAAQPASQPSQQPASQPDSGNSRTATATAAQLRLQWRGSLRSFRLVLMGWAGKGFPTLPPDATSAGQRTVPTAECTGHIVPEYSWGWHQIRKLYQQRVERPNRPSWNIEMEQRSTSPNLLLVRTGGGTVVCFLHRAGRDEGESTADAA